MGGRRRRLVGRRGRVPAPARAAVARTRERRHGLPGVSVPRLAVRRRGRLHGDPAGRGPALQERQRERAADAADGRPRLGVLRRGADGRAWLKERDAGAALSVARRASRRDVLLPRARVQLRRARRKLHGPSPHPLRAPRPPGRPVRRVAHRDDDARVERDARRDDVRGRHPRQGASGHLVVPAAVPLQLPDEARRRRVQGQLGDLRDAGPRGQVARLLRVAPRQRLVRPDLAGARGVEPLPQHGHVAPRRGARPPVRPARRQGVRDADVLGHRRERVPDVLAQVGDGRRAASFFRARAPRGPAAGVARGRHRPLGDAREAVRELPRLAPVRDPRRTRRHGHRVRRGVSERRRGDDGAPRDGPGAPRGGGLDQARDPRRAGARTRRGSLCGRGGRQAVTRGPRQHRERGVARH
mmetsp:Transcript_34919/g.105288  ORF Transcript_34919/g.105288 Transcript_34919/m.105288 type:complete len:413 (-) Transcript_34919:73-1311(-)